MVCRVTQCCWPKCRNGPGRTAVCRPGSATVAVRALTSPPAGFSGAAAAVLAGVVTPCTACRRLPLGVGLARAEALGFTPSIFTVVFC